MASMRDIKRRKSSVSSTQQITKAMKVVSTVKLQKAKAKAEATNPYFNHMYATVSSIIARSGNVDHPYLKAAEGGKKAIIVITSNRGLAGGYNSNVVKLVTGSDIPKEDVVIYNIGSKGSEQLSRRGYEIGADYSAVIDGPQYTDAVDVCDEVLQAFAAGEISEIYLAYTHFKNTVSYIPKLMKLLPISLDEIETDADESVDEKLLMNFEPTEEAALDMIIPKYVASLIYGALMEAVASENGARMTAMDSATSNAEEIISDLTLKYNRARQGSITQELTEIVAGADAIN